MASYSLKWLLPTKEFRKRVSGLMGDINTRLLALEAGGGGGGFTDSGSALIDGGDATGPGNDLIDGGDST